MDVSAGEDTNILSYNDAQNIKEGKYEAFQWACAVGLVGQDGETKLRPNDKVTREDMELGLVPWHHSVLTGMPADLLYAPYVRREDQGIL